jgi:hypothetical protein
MNELTQQEFDELILWLKKFKENKLFEIDRNIEKLKIKYPQQLVDFDYLKKEYYDKLQLFYYNVFNENILKTHRLQIEINELVRYVGIVFEYLEHKHNG